LRIARTYSDDPQADIWFGNRLDIDENDQVVGEGRFVPFTVWGYLYEGMSLSNQSAFWRSRLFSQVGMFDPELHAAMDYEFFLRAACKGSRFRRLPGYFGAIRRHCASKTNTLWGSAMEKESAVVYERYGRKSYLGHWLKACSVLRRSLYFFLQGDWDYLAHGFVRRLALLAEAKKKPVP